MKRIKAFTLVELIVAMVFSSIIITLAYSVFSNTNRSFRKALNQYGKSNELLLLQSVLNQDCNKARLVLFGNGKMIVEDIDHNRINYTITTERVIRNSGLAADTFRIGAYKDSAQFLFDKPPLLESLRLELLSKDSLNFVVTARIFYSNRMKLEYSQKIKTDNYPYGY
jgi:prepilin-type N-terminal cleavage/methylation domain-containing protein